MKCGFSGNPGESVDVLHKLFVVLCQITNELPASGEGERGYSICSGVLVPLFCKLHLFSPPSLPPLLLYLLGTPTLHVLLAVLTA